MRSSEASAGADVLCSVSHHRGLSHPHTRTRRPLICRWLRSAHKTAQPPGTNSCSSMRYGRPPTHAQASSSSSASSADDVSSLGAGAPPPGFTFTTSVVGSSGSSAAAPASSIGSPRACGGVRTGRRAFIRRGLCSCESSNHKGSQIGVTGAEPRCEQPALLSGPHVMHMRMGHPACGLGGRPPGSWGRPFSCGDECGPPPCSQTQLGTRKTAASQ